MSNFRHDVVVAGSRCAGAATAMLLARRGHDVALVDRSGFPSDTLSTHAISRAGVVQLHRWGLLQELLDGGAPAVRAVSFTVAGEESVSRTIKDSAGVDHLLAPRRHALDAVLRDAAVRAGVTTYTATVSEVIRDGSGRVAGAELRSGRGRFALEARVVIGADGRGSRLADRFGAAHRHLSTSPAGTFYAYADRLDDAGFEFHLSPSALVGVFPTHDRQSCVWISAPVADLSPLLSAGAGRTDALRSMIGAAAPALGARLRDCVIGPVRGAVGLANQVRRPAGPGWVLVGDAGYHRDPITGHGISDAFRDADLVAEAVHGWFSGAIREQEAMQRYDGARTLAIREIFAITRELTTFPGVSRFAALQRRLSQAIEREALELAARPALSSEPVLAA